MASPLHFLIVEDSQDDTELLQRTLKRGNIEAECRTVTDEAGFRAALDEGDWDLVLGDYTLPGFGAEAAMRIITDKGLDIPFIVVSGVVGMADVVSLLHSGAEDFVEKNGLDRLAPAVERTLRLAGERRALKAAEQAVRDSEVRFRELVELSPDGIMVHCDGNIVFANAAMAELLGASEPEELIGRAALDFVLPEERELVAARRAAAAAGEIVGYRETRYLRVDGGFVEVERNMARTSWEGRPGFLVVARDLTERNRAERALRDSEALLRTVIDGVPAMINYGAPDGIIRFANERYARWFGTTADQVVGRHVREVRGETAWRENLPLRDRVYNGEEVTYEGTRVVDGEERHYHATQIPHFGPDGDVQGHFALVLDTTEEHRTQQRLQESEARLRAILDNSPAAIYVVDTGERMVMVNREFLRRWNSTADEILGHRGPDLLPPDLAQIHSGLNRQVLETNSAATRIVSHRRPNGEDAINLLTKFPIPGEDGKAVAIGSISSDITEITRSQEALHETETRFRDLIEESLQGILIHVDGRPRYTNAEFRRLFGYTADELNRLPAIHDLLHPEDRERLVAYQESRHADFDTPRVYEFRGIHKDGHPINFYAKASVIDWYGERANYIAMIDVTELKLIEEQLRQAQKMEAVGQLTGGVAHDFNNLLTVVLGNLQLVEAMTDPEAETQQMVQSAVRAVRRGAELTQRLLAFSRRQPLSPVATDIDRLVGDLEELLVRTLGETIAIRLECGGGQPPAMIDPIQMENAILNLSINARDAMPEGGRLTIHTAQATLDREFAASHPGVAAGDYIHVSIADNGHGMGEDVLAQAFDPFFTTKDAGQGSGLGLSMVYGFVTQSGGHAELDSTPGQGTTVHLYLPVADGAAASHPAAQPGGEGANGKVTGDETVLVLEDDEHVRELATTLLGRLGYRTVEAEDGPAALEILRARDDIDLLFTDVVLPEGLNGRQVADQARDIRPGIKVLYTTGYAESGIVSDGLLEKGVALLNKPYTSDGLASKVRDALDRR